MKILFVCTGNTCRSPMAKVLFEDLAKKRGRNISCDSAGLSTASGLAATQNAIKVVKELGLSLEDHKSKNIADIKDLASFDLFVAMTPAHAKMMENLGIPNEKIEILGFGIPDPFMMGEDVYRETRDKISTALEKLLKTIDEAAHDDD